MGKSYVENSLKRFLKRKVKITLGLVVAFMITGVCAFAEDNREQEHKDKISGIETAIENLKGLGTGVISAGENNSYVTIEKIAEKTIIKKADDKSTIAEIDNSLISTRTAETVSVALQGIDGTNSSEINKGIISQGNTDTDNYKYGQKIEQGKIGYNYGIIAGKIDHGQKINGGTGYNYGIIANNYSAWTAEGQRVLDGGTGYNYGIIATNKNNGQYAENSTINNYGIIANAENFGQNGSGIINNYGVIANGVDYGMSIKSGVATNYGIIMNGGGRGLDIKCKDGTAYNYGIIANKGKDIVVVDGGTFYNYGVIKNNKDGGTAIYILDKSIASSKIDGTAKNYGVVINEKGTVFNGKVDNYGIVILKNQGGLGTGKNYGIILGNDYELAEKYKADVKQFHNGETVKDFDGENNFGENISKGYVLNETVKIDNTENKVIGAVVSDNSKLEDGVVFKYDNVKEKELFLNNTVITGYFEQNGTLLDVGTGNLTLSGDTNITAVKGDLSLDVTAVQIGKDGKITIMDGAKINGIIKGNENSEITFTQAKGTFDINNGEGKVVINIADGGTSKYQNYFNVTLTSSSQDKEGDTIKNNTVGEIELSTENAGDLTNKLVIDNTVKVGKNDKGYSIYDTNTTNENAELELTIENIHNIEENILLGAGKDTVIVTNNDNHVTEHLKTEINLGEGTEDKFVVVGNAVDEEGKSKNIFSYKVVNTETVELQGGTWGDWDKAEGTIGFTDSTKAGKQPNFVLGNSTTMNITLNAEGNHGSDFANYVGTKLGLDHAIITGTGNGSVIKYLIDEKGLDTANLSTKKYSFGDGVSYKDSPIFNISSTKGDGVNISVKTAGEMGLSGQDRIIYDAYIDQIKVGTANKEVIDQINGYNTSEEFAGLIKNTSVTGEAYYTAGSVVTMDIADTYLSAVEDFTKRAGKGEWLAQGKYINSDTEFDGGSKVKGYDGDVTGTVGMIEYGFTDNTSYGAVFGMGDSKMDIDGGGKLDGDNTYAGLYMKHRTQNGIELVANLGYVENDMDSVLRNDFKFDNGISSTGKTFEKGTADSSAVILSVKGRKDYRITDTVKVQPILGARATFINQEEAENPEMHFTIKEQDIIVVEGTAGMGVAKEFALPQGKLELNAGVEYTFAATSSTNDAEYTLFEGTNYQGTHIKMEDVDTAENTGTAFAGFDYEHESGVGFNGKYEMMWSDKGDDSRVTAGISYRF